MRHCGAETHALLPDGVHHWIRKKSIFLPTVSLPGNLLVEKYTASSLRASWLRCCCITEIFPAFTLHPHPHAVLQLEAMSRHPSKTLTLARDSVVIVNWTAQSIRPQVQHAKRRIRGSRMERLRVVFEVESTLGRSPGINVTGRKACFEEGVK